MTYVLFLEFCKYNTDLSANNADRFNSYKFCISASILGFVDGHSRRE